MADEDGEEDRDDADEEKQSLLPGGKSERRMALNRAEMHSRAETPPLPHRDEHAQSDEARIGKHELRSDGSRGCSGRQGGGRTHRAAQLEAALASSSSRPHPHRVTGSHVVTRLLDELSLALSRLHLALSSSLASLTSKLSVLVSPPLLRPSLLLWLLFFASTFSYYGLVLLAAQLAPAGPTASAAVRASEGYGPAGGEQGTVALTCMTGGYVPAGSRSSYSFSSNGSGSNSSDSTAGRVKGRQGLQQQQQQQQPVFGIGLRRRRLVDLPHRMYGPYSRLMREQRQEWAGGSDEPQQQQTLRTRGSPTQQRRHRNSLTNNVKTVEDGYSHLLSKEMMPRLHREANGGALRGNGSSSREGEAGWQAPVLWSYGRAMRESHPEPPSLWQQHLEPSSPSDSSQLGGQARRLPLPDGCTATGLPSLPPAAFSSVLITAAAELPGLLLTLLLVRLVGQRPALTLLLLLTGALLLPLVRPLPPLPTTALLFAARAAITGSFAVLWAYAPQVYPTAVRTTGVGVASSWGRVGGIICPFVAVGLINTCQRVSDWGNKALHCAT